MGSKFDYDPYFEKIDGIDGIDRFEEIDVAWEPVVKIPDTGRGSS